MAGFITDSEDAEAATSGTYGHNLTWTLDGDTLTISGTGAMYGHSLNNSSPWGTSFTNLVINDGVTSIGSCAFYGCSSLTKIDIPDSVTEIGGSAFSECSSLTKIDIPDSVTSIGDEAFRGCSSLTKIDIPEGVTSIGDEAFRGCSSLTSVVIPEGVTSIGDEAFRGCSELTSVVIPDGVTSIGSYAFYGCSGLTSVVIPDGVTSIGSYAFYGCSGLTSVTIGNGVTSIGNSAFRGCSGLTSVVIPDGVTSIGSYAFYGCSELTSVTIGNGVKSIGEVPFYGINPNAKIILDNNPNFIVDDGVLYDKDKKRIIYYSPNGVAKDYTIPKTVDYSNSLSLVFANCNNLENIYVENGSELSSVDGCLVYNNHLLVYPAGRSVINIPSEIDGLYSYCFTGANVEIANLCFNRNDVYIGDAPFLDCVNLKKIILDESAERGIKRSNVDGLVLFTDLSGTKTIEIVASEGFTVPNNDRNIKFVYPTVPSNDNDISVTTIAIAVAIAAVVIGFLAFAVLRRKH